MNVNCKLIKETISRNKDVVKWIKVSKMVSKMRMDKLLCFRKLLLIGNIYTTHTHTQTHTHAHTLSGDVGWAEIEMC